jgi:hypothetical protein
MILMNQKMKEGFERIGTMGLRCYTFFLKKSKKKEKVEPIAKDLIFIFVQR